MKPIDVEEFFDVNFGINELVSSLNDNEKTESSVVKEGVQEDDYVKETEEPVAAENLTVEISVDVIPMDE